MIGNISAAANYQPRKRNRKVQIRCPVGVEHALIVPRQLRVSDEDARDTFNMFDRRRVGYFTEKDVKRVFGGSGPQFHEFLNRFDVNHDGKVEFDEFKETMAEFVSEKGDLNLFERIYVTFSEPSSCLIARWFSLVIMFLILLSTLSFVLDTVPSFKVRRWSTSCCGVNEKYLLKYELQGISPTPAPTAVGDSMSKCPCEPESPYIFYLIELVCIAIFTFEYLTRLFTVWASRFGPDFELVLDVVTVHRSETCPPLKRVYNFVLNTMNVIDLLAILPFYITLLEERNGGGGSGLGFLRVLRLARVFRVFKMGKYNKGMQLFTKVMVHSAPALKLLCFFTVIGMILFGSMIYFFERGTFVATDEYPEGVYLRPDVTGLRLAVSPFTSIPACFWWVITTQTTVGYGDSYPTSDTGKVIGSLCMITGVLVLALPITIIGANFANEYAKVQADEARERHLEIARKNREEEQQEKLKKEGENHRSQMVMLSKGQVMRSVVRKKDQEIHPLEVDADGKPVEGGDLVVGEDGMAKERVSAWDHQPEEMEEGMHHDDEMEGLETDLEIVEVEMNQQSSELIGLIREYIEAERLTKLAGDCMLTEINFVMASLQNKELMHVPPERVQGLLQVAWHWIGRCEKDDTVVLFTDHKLKLLRKFLEFAASTIKKHGE